MAELSDENLLAKLRYLVETIEIATLLTTPVHESIESLLNTSAAAIGSDGASVLVREGDEGELRFAWAIGSVASLLIEMTVPAGKGIAGFVYSSGQPLAVSDTEQESEFYAEVDRSTGFSTHSILATPLRFEGEVIGVLEYVNRKGAPPYKPFTSEEMDLAAVYADAIAALVHAHESASILGELSGRILDDDDLRENEDLRKWLDGVEGVGRQKEMLDLAILLRELSSRGEPERRLCVEIIESILRHSGPKADYSQL